MKTKIVYGRPGHWIVEDIHTGIREGPFTTRAKAQATADEVPETEPEEKEEDQEVVMRLLVERGDNGRIKEVKVLKG